MLKWFILFSRFLAYKHLAVSKDNQCFPWSEFCPQITGALWTLIKKKSNKQTRVVWGSVQPFNDITEDGGFSVFLILSWPHAFSSCPPIASLVSGIISVCVGLDIERMMDVYSSHLSHFCCWLSCSGPKLDITLNTFVSSHAVSNSSGNTRLLKLARNLTASTDHEFPWWPSRYLSWMLGEQCAAHCWVWEWGGRTDRGALRVLTSVSKFQS